MESRIRLVYDDKDEVSKISDILYKEGYGVYYNRDNSYWFSKVIK